MKTELVQNYNIDENGKAVLVSEEQVEVQGPSIEEKEAELLKVYAELEELKNNN
jgi:hypothetical protein